MNQYQLTNSTSNRARFFDRDVKSFGLNLLGKFMAGTVLALSLTASAFAAPIVGFFNVGTGTVNVTNGNITFNVIPSSGGLDFEVATNLNTRGGSFSDAAFGVANNGGTIGDLTNNPGPNFFPLGPTNQTRVGWLTLTARPTYIFTLTQLVQGQTVTSGNVSAASPYILSQNGQNVSASFSVIGTLLEAGDNPINTTRFDGIISTQFTSTNVQALVDLIIGGGQLPDNSWSGTFVATNVPEPATMALMGVSLLAVVAYRRKRS